MGPRRETVVGEEAAFRGTFDHTLDEKGRVSVPVEFREVIARQSNNEVVLTNFICDGARCLEGYLRTEWESFEKKLKSRSRFDPQIRSLENFYLARATRCTLDGSGRINIPAYLRQYAGFEREVVFTASLHGFRMWEKRVWELVFREAEATLLENPAIFKDVDL